MPYKANRGGHAPGYLRDAFENAIDESGEFDDSWYPQLGDEQPIFFNDPKLQDRWDIFSPKERGRLLIGQLWNCTDIMPSNLCSNLDLPSGSTFAKGVRKCLELMD
jgi:hypothetical protein